FILIRSPLYFSIYVVGGEDGRWIHAVVVSIVILGEYTRRRSLIPIHAYSYFCSYQIAFYIDGHSISDVNIIQLIFLIIIIFNYHRTTDIKYTPVYRHTASRGGNAWILRITCCLVPCNTTTTHG